MIATVLAVCKSKDKGTKKKPVESSLIKEEFGLVTREMDGDVYVVRLQEPPVEGKGNRVVLKLLARHFGVPENGLRIVSGLASRNKVIEVMPVQGGGR